jgi:hypothetical protein
LNARGTGDDLFPLNQWAVNNRQYFDQQLFNSRIAEPTEPSDTCDHDVAAGWILPSGPGVMRGKVALTYAS